jgi:anaphase-promoting complex subunit 6
MEVCVLEALQ